ncbi:hypothetical protein MNV49_004554 [Pseudohyphozyma bogoriensis]|nr:hypothetical protein MNV49_004554 [Pseudohyphozyma bogoriensis]
MSFGIGGNAASLFFSSLPITETQPIYAVVGGNGNSGSFDVVTVAGGYNGGGGSIQTSGYLPGGGGGGATDLRTIDPNVDGSLDSRLYVAESGGAAGLEDGADGTVYSNTAGSGGTQTAGGTPNGAFGIGGDGDGNGGGGGGGWYGGGGSPLDFNGVNYGGGGGGGSSYVGDLEPTFKLTTAAPTIQFTYNPCHEATPVPVGPVGSARARMARRQTVVPRICPERLKPCPLPSGSYECVFVFEDCEA